MNAGYILTAVPFAWQAAIVFLIGSLVGSFLNVCIYRLPRGESVVTPRSHCTSCLRTIRWYDNIPFVSYVLLGGRCRFCKQSFSPRYLLIESLTALAFLMFFLRHGLTLEFFKYSAFACGLIVSTFVDFSHRIIPDEISVGGTIAGFAFAFFKGLSVSPLSWSHRFLVDSVVGACAGAGSIFMIGFVFDLVYFKMLKKPAVEGETQSMGGGDVKLMAMVGAFLGWKLALLTFFLAPFFGIIAGVVNLITRKSHLIPYGPFLSLAAVLAMFYGDYVISLFFRPLFLY